MATNPFALSAAGNPFASRGATNPFAPTGDPLGMFDVAPGDDSIFGSLIGLPVAIVRELARDVAGAGKVAGATVGELASLAFDNVPYTWEQLESRDVQGALSIAALAAGGVLGGVASKSGLAKGFLAAGAKKGALNQAGRRAVVTASAEFVAGTAFGLIRPLEAGESRFEAVRDEAVFGAAVGAGASTVKSAIKATIGGRVSAIRRARHRTLMADAAKTLDDEALLQELAGVSLLDPATGNGADVFRNSKGRFTVTMRESGQKVSDDFATMAEAMASLKKRGFIEEGITARRYRNIIPKRGAEKGVDAGFLEQLERDEKGRLISSQLGDLHLQQYSVVRDAGLVLKSSDDEMAFVMAEAVAPSAPNGPYQFPTADRRAEVIRDLKHAVDPKMLDGMTDGEVLKEAIKEGLVDVENIWQAGNQDQFLRELILNDRVLEPEFVATLLPHSDGFLLGALTPKTLGRIFPRVAPMIDDATARIRVRDKRKLIRGNQIDDLARRVSREEADRGVALIDDVSREFMERLDADPGLDVAALVAEADAEVLRRAQDLGGAAQVFVEEVVPMLSEYRKELIEIGRLQDGGIAAYFPIVNGNKWRATVPDGIEGVTSFQGFWASQEEALQHIAQLQKEFPEIGNRATVSPNRFMMEFDDVMNLDPREYGRVIKALKQSAEAQGAPLSNREAREIADQSFRVRSPLGPKRGAGILKKRHLGSRAFSRDAFDALRSYANVADNLIAMEAEPGSLFSKLDDAATALQPSSFQQFSQSILDSLPQGQNGSSTALREWVEQYRDDMLGRPRKTEILFDNLIQALGIEAPPRALKRYSGMLRKWQTFSRLGGFMSGIVNLTQIPINTVPILGVKDTMKGMEALIPGKSQDIIRTLLDLNIIDDAFVPFADDTLREMALLDGSVSAALKNKNYKDALYRMHLSVFNGAEKVNRMVTGWGAFQAALKENGGNRAAAAASARAVVDRTQFNYSLANLPGVLRSPAGAVILQFKSFVINELEFIASLSPRQMATMAASFGAMGGAAAIVNIPGGDVVNLASNLAFGERVDDALERRVGNESSPLARLGVYGIPGLVKVDLSDYVGTGNFADITRSLVGPTGTDIQALGTFLKEASADFKSAGIIAPETKARFVGRLLPSSMRRMQRAASIASTGEVRNPYSGKLIYQPHSRAWSATRAAIGIPELDQSREMAANRVTEEVRDRYLRGARSYAKAVAAAIAEGRTQEAAEIRGTATAEGFDITDRQIRYWVEQRGRDGDETRRRRLPVATRDEWVELYEISGGFEF